jgi:phosphoribosylformylglycinamidine synthase
LFEYNQVVFRYADANGIVSEESNPNGSVNNIAGIINKKGNILGMMPHPERSTDPVLGKTDGSLIFKSIASYLLNKEVKPCLVT